MTMIPFNIRNEKKMLVFSKIDGLNGVLPKLDIFFGTFDCDRNRFFFPPSSAKSLCSSFFFISAEFWKEMRKKCLCFGRVLGIACAKAKTLLVNFSSRISIFFLAWQFSYLFSTFFVCLCVICIAMGAFFGLSHKNEFVDWSM